MILQDFHIHSNYCDGENTPEEIVIAAIKKGMEKLGILCHSYTSFDTRYCIKKEKIADFQKEIKNLAQKYKDKIQILCGVEQDYFSTESTEGFDYVIGSVHYCKKNGEYFAIDSSEEHFLKAVRECYNGDYIAFCVNYFKNISDVVEKTNADMIGHFDLVAKFNENDRLFDTSDPRYMAAAKAAIDILLKYDKPFEINTGAITRGYRSAPYPGNFLIEYIKERGGKLVLSSDSHSTDSICGYFNSFEGII